jgi:hypothetical protein
MKCVKNAAIYTRISVIRLRSSLDQAESLNLTWPSERPLSGKSIHSLGNIEQIISI